MSYLNDYASNKGITETLDDFDRRYINVEELIDYMNKRIEYLEKELNLVKPTSIFLMKSIQTQIAEIQHWLAVLEQRQVKRGE